MSRLCHHNLAPTGPATRARSHIKQATKEGPDDAGLAIHVGAYGPQEMVRTMVSSVSNDVDGVPLKTTLRSRMFRGRT
jgi:hypothetical protein